MLNFEFPEDREFFANLLTGGDVNLLDNYRDYFDFRSPVQKRKEYDMMRDELFRELVNRDGYKCGLRIHPDCTIDKDLQIDHIIPLSSNELNKQIRQLPPEKGKKVKTQSWGSNYIGNLMFACPKCNNRKKHKFMVPAVMPMVSKV